MRKILIDDKVRGIADDYAANVFKNRKRDFRQPIDLLRSFRVNVLESRDDTVGKVLCAYVDLIIEKHCELLHAEPSAMGNLIDKFNGVLNIVGATRKEKEQGIRLFMNKRIEFGEEKHEFNEWIVSLMRYDDVCSRIIPYLEKLNIRTCVYCNAQYAATARIERPRSTKYEAFYELDHFYPKSLYPFLCTNFYNLQPCCGSCNKHKLDNPSLFNLYTNDATEDRNPFLFSVPKECVVGKYLVSNEIKDIDIHFNAPGNKTLLENHEKNFHITALYAAFKDVAAEIIWKRKAWDESYIKMLSGQYEGLSIPENIQKRIVFGFYTETEEIHLRPLTKLQQDLFKQQDIIR